MQYWLLKTEPDCYSFAELQRERRTIWDDVRNALAQRNLRQAQVGDPCVIYHTGEERAAVGTARVVRAAYPDPEHPERTVIDVEAGESFRRPVPLSELKQHPAFAASPLVRISRLSVVPLEPEQFELIAAAGRAVTDPP